MTQHDGDPSDAPVLTAVHGAVRVLTLNRPTRLNAWNAALETAYFSALDEAERDPEVRAVVVTGAGRGFCAGGDIDELLDEATDAAGRWPRSRPFAFRKPLVAAINGACAGIGLVQALYCDVRFVAPAAKLTTAFARRGLPGEYGITWLLPRIVGRAHATDLLVSGRTFDGREAGELGLANRVVAADDLLAAAIGYAREIAEQCSPAAIAAIKSQLALDAEDGFAGSLERAHALLEVARERPDLAEGVASFVERRPPRFPPLAP